MKANEILLAVYNDKPVLEKVMKSINEYSVNLKSMEQLKQDCKDIEKHVKDTFGINANTLKELVKVCGSNHCNLDEKIEYLDTLKLFTQENDKVV